MVVPDEPLTLDITELPLEGRDAGFIVRFTLRTKQGNNWATGPANLQGVGLAGNLGGQRPTQTR